MLGVLSLQGDLFLEQEVGMKTATFVGRYLAVRGVKRAFGHPGSDVMDLVEGLERAEVDFILTHHENSDAFMASVGGLLTGVPGVVVVLKGPGVTNVVSGVGAATLDRALLLCPHRQRASQELRPPAF